MPNLELIDDEYIGVSFQYDRGVVQQLRKLNARRWNPEKRRWEVHIVHLADVMKIFHLRPEDVPPDIVARYQNQWIKAKILIRVGNSFTQAEGGQLPIEKIDEVTSFPVFGHHFNLQYLDGKWDGRKHLFDRRNFTFPTGLLDRVLGVMRQEGVGFEIQDLREGAGSDVPEMGDLPGALPHVREAVEACAAARRGVLELAPGSGKWDVVARMVERLDAETVLLVSGRESLARAVRELGDRLKEPVGQAGGDQVRLGRFMVMSTPVACSAFGIRLGKTHAGEDLIEDPLEVTPCKRDLGIKLRDVPVLFFDEVHTVPADTCYQIVMRCQSAEWRLGFSAAPRRADGHDMLLEAAFGPFIHHTDISSLIENKLAVPGEIHFIQPQTYPPCERDRQPEEIFERAILANEARHDLVAAQARALAKQGRRVVVLAHDLDHAKTLQARLPKSLLLEGRGDEEERRRAVAALESRKGSALVIAPVEGEYLLDFPNVNGVVLAAPGASETKALERVSRSLAPAEGKKNTRIVDFFDPVPYLKEKSAKRMEMLQSQPALKVVTEGF